MLKEYAQNSNLKKAVLESIYDYAELYNDDEKTAIINYCRDVVDHGCVSGIVTNLIYYSDTIAFFEEHKKEIKKLFKNYFAETGGNFNDFHWYDEEDPFFEDTQNQNWASWFAYESICYEILNLLED